MLHELEREVFDNVNQETPTTMSEYMHEKIGTPAIDNATDFKNFAMSSIQDFLPHEYESADVKLERISKTSESYDGLVVVKDGRPVPIVNLDAFYEEFVHGKKIHDVMTEMAKIIQMEPGSNLVKQANDIVTGGYEAVKDRLFIRLANAERAAEIVQKAPHQELDDLVVTYHCELMNDPNSGLSSITITNDLLKKFGVSLDQLHKDAIENSANLFPPHVASLQGMFMRDDGTPAIDQQYIITNTAGINGAAALLYPDSMQEVVSQIEAQDGPIQDFRGLYVIPSSIHEVIVIVDHGQDLDIDSLDETIRMVNETQVSKEDRLSDHMYHYSDAYGLEAARDYLQHQQNLDAGVELA